MKNKSITFQIQLFRLLILDLKVVDSVKLMMLCYHTIVYVALVIRLVCLTHLEDMLVFL